MTLATSLFYPVGNRPAILSRTSTVGTRHYILSLAAEHLFWESGDPSNYAAKISRATMLEEIYPRHRRLTRLPRIIQPKVHDDVVNLKVLAWRSPPFIVCW